MNTDLEILRALRSAGPEGVSGADLSNRLKISRAAVWARIRELRGVGYEIVASPHLGYRLVSSPDRLHADDLLARLGQTRVIGRDIRVFEETSSTNDVIDKMARDGVPEGIVVFAERQTHGRGRLGRSWVSPRHKGLWFSILLRPELRPQDTTRLTIASATAVRRAVQRTCGVEPGVKWPNDIVVNGRKIAGILTELHAELDRIRYVVLGIGVDVNLSKADFDPSFSATATSLLLETGHDISRADLAVAILKEFDDDYAAICSGDFARVAAEWEEHCTTIGQNIVLRGGDRLVSGRAESLGEDGALLVRTEHGRIERVTGGDLTMEKRNL